MVLNETIYPRIVSIAKNTVCELGGFEEIFYYFWLPFIIITILLLILLYTKKIKAFWQNFLIKRGRLKILYVSTNKQLKEKLLKIDKFNRFKINKKSYSLEKMQNYVLGYLKNVPVFLFDENFIMPLVVTKKNITQLIKKTYEEQTGEKLTTESLSQISMKLEPDILETVYSRKLMSDLYSSVGMTDDLKRKVFWAVVIGVGLLILWYTGYLDIILSYLV